MALMKKNKATALFGGNSICIAKAIGITPQAYSQWPGDLSKRMEDRVVAAFVRTKKNDWHQIWPELSDALSPPPNV